VAPSGQFEVVVSEGLENRPALTRSRVVRRHIHGGCPQELAILQQLKLLFPGS
jgi:hypothetical protein